LALIPQQALAVVEAAAREGLAQHDRLMLARQVLERKCKGRRENPKPHRRTGHRTAGNHWSATISRLGDRLSAPAGIEPPRHAHVTHALLQLFYGVNDGRDVIKFADNFALSIQTLRVKNEALCGEMMATDRWQRAMAKENARKGG
jgi:hypothetical protein